MSCGDTKTLWTLSSNHNGSQVGLAPLERTVGLDELILVQSPC